jgi:uncharacterized hydrophobic protein (TIGR00271 family)
VLHLRLVVPPDDLERVLAVLVPERGVANLAVLPGAAREPAGDLVLGDVTRESAHSVLRELRRLGLPEHGSISVEQVDLTLSAAADRAERLAPGSPADALVWEEVQAKTSEESELSWTFLTFISVATLIAGIGVLLDQTVLIIGAMVVGPEFGAIAGLCVAILRRRRELALRSARALVVGFPVAIAVTTLATLAGRAVGLVEDDMLDAAHPLTSFVSRPDAFSFVVAFLAGVVGMLSLTSAKSGALIGVLISVTTVPAAGYIGVALALGEPGGAGGAVAQLAINLVALVVAGVLTLAAQAALWQRVRPSRRLGGRTRTASPAARQSTSAPGAVGTADPAAYPRPSRTVDARLDRPASGRRGPAGESCPRPREGG